MHVLMPLFSALAPLPPHALSLCELDPCCENAVTYLRRLQRRGVRAHGRIVPGMPHAGDLLLARAVPDVFAAAVHDLAGFVASL